MESTTEQESCNWSQRKTRRQLTAKREDSPPHSAARTGNLALMRDMITRLNGKDSREEFLKQNQSGETALYVASEYGFQEIVSELMKYHDTVSAGIKAKNGYDSLHIAAKQGDVGQQHSHASSRCLHCSSSRSRRAKMADRTSRKDSAAAPPGEAPRTSSPRSSQVKAAQDNAPPLRVLRPTACTSPPPDGFISTK
ncbi:Ankyrin repeat-containing protein [Platanthera guangdongensis]|uniref:Ankyrin repeat-containing protein n=1 Tax=Platanthera guangdongensis TaxID=2320717 RepID=A0ABR2MH43_9ASPA